MARSIELIFLMLVIFCTLNYIQCTTNTTEITPNIQCTTNTTEITPNIQCTTNTTEITPDTNTTIITPHTNTTKITTRIAGGKATTISKRPYVVYLRIGGRFSCGGSLVGKKKRHVITAAHCVKRVKRGRVTVHGGSTYLRKKGVARSVVKIFIPRAFNFRTMAMDVAVLKLKSPMNGTNIEPIELYTGKLKAGTRALISGWGLQKEKGRSASNQIRSAQIKLLKKSRCRKSYSRTIQIQDGMICASMPGRRDACTGDSGGPLVINKKLAGIVSFGYGCNRAKFPGVYTSIASNRIRSFITKALAK